MNAALAPVYADLESRDRGRFATRRATFLAKYGVAVISILTAWGLSVLLAPYVGGSVSPLFYLAVMIGAWYGGMGPGLITTALAGFITAWFFMDPPGSLQIGWDDVLRLIVFVIEAVLISSLSANRRRAALRLLSARDELEARVLERTAALAARTAELQSRNEELQRQAIERRTMQHAILEISEREQARIGHDLHDGLGQELTGISFLSKALAQNLAAANRPEAAEANEVVGLVKQAIVQTRELARGLFPTLLDAQGLSMSLRQLAYRVEKLFAIECDLDSANDVGCQDKAAEMHLYRIAQEAIHNAVKHGRAKHVRIRLHESDGASAMTVSDDGTGFTPLPNGGEGMGLAVMHYRAKMIFGSLEVCPRASDGGTRITCIWPAVPASAQQEGVEHAAAQIG